MIRIQHLMLWITVSILSLSVQLVSAQCLPPGAVWLNAPQTSTALPLNWTQVNGVTQYQIRFWETAAPGDKTIINDFVSAPFLLQGLKKATTYTVQVRAVCGSITSPWSNAVSYLTAKATEPCANPAGVLVTPGIGMLTINWASFGSHTIRYRLGYTGDWLIPSGALSVSTPPFVLSGLAAGTYQIEIKHNCGASASNFLRQTKIVQYGCATPAAPMVIPSITAASVILPVVNGVTGYNIMYRIGTTGNWVMEGNNVQTSLLYLNPPLAPVTQYQVEIQAVCSTATSGYSSPTTFSTLSTTSCLANKNFGKNLSAADKDQIDADYNTPSPFTFGSMIGVNDGGLIFRSFQNSLINQMTQLTTQYRSFHTVDQDFDSSLTDYDQNIKPKDTNPEGTPANTGYNKGLYNLYRNTHGFTNITAATELLQYTPQSWKDKMYKESDWSLSGPSGIKTSFEHYTQKFIDEFAPAGGLGSQLLISNFQVGNELWDYPVKADYHSLLIGARNAFISRYGLKSAGAWKMKLVAGAFQAFRDNNCPGTLRDFSNCGGSLQRHDFIGDYLDVPDCDVLKDLDAIDCHPYSFLPGTTTWTYPEDPLSEGWQIRNMAGWLNANRSSSTGVLLNTHLWSTEYGFDSNARSGVGEKTQAAFLIRGLLLHSRYHYEKVFFYNGFDHARITDPSYSSLYGSSGFWRLGTEPANSAWPSPQEENGATPKPSWFGMLDLKTRFGGHVFYKALVEDSTAFVYLMAKPDGTDPYLVFWSPKQTTDANVNDDVPVTLTANWSGILPEDYTLESGSGQSFAVTTMPGQVFSAATNSGCNTAIFNTVRRTPSFVRLVPCNNCPSVVSFKRYQHFMSGCNPAGDYYFEIVLNNVTANDQVLLSGLPGNGVNPGLSSLNGATFNLFSFQANLQYISNSSYRWMVNTANGSTQTLRLYYCWADNYPSPVAGSIATPACSGVTTPCIVAGNFNEPNSGDRTEQNAKQPSEEFRFTVQPNPGKDYLLLTYYGTPETQATLRIVSTTGQMMSMRPLTAPENNQQWPIDVMDLPPGIYFLCLQTNGAVKYLIWEKM